jgi:hypothetical protein
MPHSQREGKEGAVNAIMSFSVMLYIWLGLTVAAAIAGAIAHRFSGH